MAAGIWKLGTQNAITTTLDGSITDSDQTIPLTSSDGLQYPGIITIDRLNALNEDTPTVREYVSYTGISGNSLTGCERGVGNSTAQAHGSDALVEENWTISHWNDFVEAWLVGHSTAGAHSKGVQTLTYSGTINIALSLGNIFQTTLAGDPTFTISNATVGQVFVLRLIQDGSGNHTIGTWFSTIKWEDGVAPTLTATADKIDVFTFIVTSAGNYDGFVVGQNL
jgi:hypothetical protein